MHVVMAYMSGNPSFAGGVDQVIATRARWLGSRGHRVSIVCQGDENFSGVVEVSENVTAYPVLVPQIPGKRTGLLHPLLPKRMAASLLKLQGIEPISVIDLHDSPLAATIPQVASEYLIPITYTVHSATLDIPNQRPRPIQNFLVDRECLAFKTATLALAVSNSVADQIRYAADDLTKIRIVPNPISPDFWSAGSAPRSFTDSPSPLEVIFAARLNHVKGLDVLLHAVALIPQSRRPVVSVYGRGPDEAALRALTEQLGLGASVQFKGFLSSRTELVQAFRASDLFVAPTRYESFGLSALEALSCGTPCALSNLAPCVEVGGDAALFFDLEKPEELAQILERLSDDRSQLQKLSEASRRQATSYLPEVTLPLLESAYQEAVDRKLAEVRRPFSAQVALGARPTVSVVIPAYNLERYIGDAIRSVQAQTEQPIEIVVSDDGSTDATVAVAESYGVRVISGPKANGSVARNRGAEAARGEFLMFLDGDDWWHPFKLAIHLDAFSNQQEGFLIDQAFVVIGGVCSLGRIGEFGGPKPDWKQFLDWRAWASGSSFSIRRDDYWKIGGFNEKLIALQDVDFWVRAAHEFGAGTRIPLGLTYYRVLPKSVSKSPQNVEHNLAAVLSGWPFADEESRRAFSQQTYLTAARWCTLAGGRPYLAHAGWPVHRGKFWRTLVSMAANTVKSIPRGRK